MSWQKDRRRKSNDGPGLGTAIAVGAAAAGVAALAWGAKKLYDAMSDSKTETSYGTDTRGHTSPTRQPESFTRFASEEHKESFQQGPKIKVVESPKKPDVSYGWEESSTSSGSSSNGFVVIGEDDLSPSILQNELIEYYDTYVYIPKKDKRRAMHVATTVMNRIQHFIENTHPGISENFMGVGSAFDGTQVIKSDNFDILIPIKLAHDAAGAGEDLWSTKDGRESMGWSSATGFSLVTRGNIPDPAADELSLDKVMDSLMIDNTFLSPMKARIFFRDLVQAAINADENLPFSASVSTVGLCTTVTVLYDDRQLHLNFMPAVMQDLRLFTADPYPRCEQEHDCEEGYQKLWQESFARQEDQKINSLDAHSNCHVRCLQLVKAIAVNDKQHIGMLSSYHLKTVLLHLMDRESHWESGALWERVTDMLRLLEFYLRERRLPHYYIPEINLLENYGRHALDDLKNYITSMLRKDSITSLLKKEISK